MTERIVDLAERPARLRADNGRLVVESEGERLLCAPFGELAAVIATHPQISFTQAVLSGLADAGCAFITCDEKRRPVAMLLPLIVHSLQAERFAAQAALSAPARKQIWKQIVQAKLRAQGELLAEITGNSRGLERMAARVRSGDPENLEAQAARIYWKALFGAYDFRRHAEGDGFNACLDYGYAVLRAVTARALCGAGLQPTLGIHHHNRYNPFCLADDLMEPFRPVVDRVVRRLSVSRGAALVLDAEAKGELLGALLGRYECDGERRTLFDWVAKAAFRLSAIVAGEEEKLEIARLRDAAP
jgi:CRISPR-associated protein Cas1